MERLTKIRILINVVIVTICLTVSNEVKSIDLIFINPQLSKILGIVLSILIALSLERFIIRSSSKMIWFRKLLFGKIWLEGCWIIDTYDLNDNIISSGIGKMTYNYPNLDLQISGYFPIGIRSKKSTFSISKDIYLREDDLLYINYFTSNSSPNTLVGVAVGHFYVDYKETFPSKFDGIIYYNDGKPAVKQILKKIKNKEIKALLKEKDWEEKFVKKFGEFYNK